MAQTVVTFRCGHAGTLPVDAQAAAKIMMLQQLRHNWCTLCPSCRASQKIGVGDNG